MAAKEKAIELYEKMWDVYQHDPVAKECALICVDDKIISINKFKHPTNSNAMNKRVDKEIKILQAVKQELNKL